MTLMKVKCPGTKKSEGCRGIKSKLLFQTKISMCTPLSEKALAWTTVPTQLWLLLLHYRIWVKRLQSVWFLKKVIIRLGCTCWEWAGSTFPRTLPSSPWNQLTVFPLIKPKEFFKMRVDCSTRKGPRPPKFWHGFLHTNYNFKMRESTSSISMQRIKTKEWFGGGKGMGLQIGKLGSERSEFWPSLAV